MKHAKPALAAIVMITLIFGFNQNLFSWNIFGFFADFLPPQITIEMLRNFKPDKDFTALPPLDGKPVFEAIEDLSILRNEEVRTYIYIYLTHGRPYVIEGIRRSAWYLPIIQEIHRKKETVPDHVVLLPLLESGFHPRAISRSGAVGLWQFMYATGRGLGLEVDAYVDERRHIEKSTLAAMTHLVNMHTVFKSWELALAAYNGGGGHVAWALAKSGNLPFWELIKTPYLTRETREYVPRFLALATIYRHQRLFGIRREVDLPGKEKTVTVTIPHAIGLNRLSQETGIPLEIIQRYNPHLNGDMTPPSKINDTIRIPEKFLEKYKKASEILFNREITGVIPHRIQAGETVSGIALKHKKKLLTLSSSTV